MTATAPAADAPPSISAFRATGKSESAAQAEYNEGYFWVLALFACYFSCLALAPSVIEYRTFRVV